MHNAEKNDPYANSKGPDQPVNLRGLIGVFSVHRYTDNPLYTDTRYNDKIPYNNNLAVA